MRLSILVTVVATLIAAGCSSRGTPAGRPSPTHLETLAIRAGNQPLGFLQSDRHGAILYAQDARALETYRWTVNGATLLEGLALNVDGKSLAGERPDSVTILPDLVRLWFRRAMITLSVVEGIPVHAAHAIAVDVTGSRALSVSAPFSSGRGANGFCVQAVDSSAQRVRCLVSTGNDSGERWTPAVLDSLARGRARRMEALLDSSYVRLPEDTLNLALQWAKLTLDALVVEQGDTLAIGEVPWDGSYNLRSNIQSITALGMLGNGYARAGGVLRAVARHADENRRSPTFGRIADRVKGDHATYAGADIAPWFSWEMYNYVTRCNDTAMAHSMFPALVRSIDATRAAHVDGKGLLTHGPSETWMSGIPRGNRAVELQLFWYFQQLVGSYIGSFVGDTTAARKYWDGSVLTSDAFAATFEDTSRSYLPDALRSDGVPDTTVRASALSCLEMAENVTMRVKMTRTAVDRLLTPDGVQGYCGGPVWTWLTGPMTYALTRIDRPDLARDLLRSMARRMLTSGIVGGLPDQIGAASPGPMVSLRGNAEFIRTVNEEFLGIRVDLASGDLTVAPKLPDDWTDVAFSAAIGEARVIGTYRRGPEGDRVSFFAADIPRSMRVVFMWILPNGDAWRGAVTLHPGTPLDLVMKGDEIVAFQGEKEGAPESKRLLRRFSQHDVMRDLQAGEGK
jgi:hypothetical protein